MGAVAIAVLGFLAATGLVIVLGLGSTARYEFDRNRATQPRSGHDSRAAPTGKPRLLQPAASLSGGPASSAGLAVEQPGGADGRPLSAAAAPMAARAPAGSRTITGPPSGSPSDCRSGSPSTGRGADAGGGAGTAVAVAEPRQVGWWLIPAEEDIDEPASRPGAGPPAPATLAGPFPDLLDAEAAVLTSIGGSTGPGAGLVAVYGVRRTGGALVRRPAPAELAWLAELGGLLDRLPAEWDTVVGDTDPRTTLVVELAAALAEAGLPLHDCDSRSTDAATDDTAADSTAGAGSGGVCLTPHPAGVLVSWAATDRLTAHTGRAGVEVAVRATMAAAVADLLTVCGFPVQFQSASSAVLVPVLER